MRIRVLYTFTSYVYYVNMAHVALLRQGVCPR